MQGKILRGILTLVLVVGLALIAGLGYVQLTYRQDFGTTPLPSVVASKDPDVIRRGEYLTHAVAHCSSCHGPAEAASSKRLATDLADLRGGFAIKAGPFGTFYPSNLTPDPTGIGARSDAELARVIRHGVGPDGTLDAFMSFVVGPMSDEDLIAVVSYLRSIKPIANKTQQDEWGIVAKALSGKFSPNSRKAPTFVREGEPSAERGEYLANGPASCVHCHSPFDIMQGGAPAGPPFSGAHQPEPDPTDPSYEIVAPNLTTDKATGVLANYTEEAFIDRFKKGGRTHKGSIMPWENFARLSDEDLRSIHRYLTKVPPAIRAVGPTRRPRGSFKG